MIARLRIRPTRRSVVLIGLAVVAITTVPAAATADAATPTAVGADCVAGVLVIGAQGTDENDNGTARAVADALRTRLPATSVRFDELPYEPASLRPFLSYPARYDQAVRQRGVPALVGLLRDHLSRCAPSEHIVLAGYSQGADVAATAWDAVMTDGGMQRFRGRMDGLLLFGHPRFDPAQRDEIDAYSLALGGARGHGIFGAAGVSTWSRTAETQHLMHSWCFPHDPICDASATSSFLTTGVHLTYHAPATDAGRQMARWLAGHYGLN